ncbi:hypothetical protein PTKIN_Ptkin15bG0065700 [Pterospermum kingtungense]
MYFQACLNLGLPCPNSLLRRKVWDHIWSAKVVPKVKFFMWRVVHGIVPTASTLHYRGLDLETSGRVCGGELETLQHIFFGCLLAIQFWSLAWPSLFSFVSFLVYDVVFWDKVFEFVAGSDKISLFFYSCWCLWLNWNKSHFKYVCSFPKGLHHVVCRFVQESDVSLQTESLNVLSLIAIMERWQPSRAGFIKINVDVAYDQICGSAAVAVVARDSLGQVVHYSSRYIRRVHNVLHSELEAINVGPELALFNNLKNVEVESDSLMAIQEVTKSYSTFCEFGSLIYDTCSLSEMLGGVHFMHISRKFNGFAHNLAQYTRRYEDYSSWSYSLPSLCCNPDI